MHRGLIAGIGIDLCLKLLIGSPQLINQIEVCNETQKFIQVTSRLSRNIVRRREPGPASSLHSNYSNDPQTARNG